MLVPLFPVETLNVIVPSLQITADDITPELSPIVLIAPECPTHPPQ